MMMCIVVVCKLPTIGNLNSGWMCLCSNFGSNKLLYWNAKSRTLGEVTFIPYKLDKSGFFSISGNDMTSELSINVFEQHVEDEKNDVIFVLSHNVFITFDPSKCNSLTPKSLYGGESKYSKKTWQKIPFDEEKRSQERLNCINSILLRTENRTPGACVNSLVDFATNIYRNEKKLKPRQLTVVAFHVQMINELTITTLDTDSHIRASVYQPIIPLKKNKK
eukprot:TRINITY_DN13432_c0_g1_i5.p1 TRINITY_DN13432_c0_g1~~TRINITY_DN13432_c0_g1_i5.p1  ORF type:complete len:220 (-),score=38.67 TRINITY_DN13432_c0_g1_i5:79-738(-)